VTYLDKYAHCCKCEDAEELDEEKSPVQYLKKKKTLQTQTRSKEQRTQVNSRQIKTFHDKAETKLGKDQDNQQ
jgi:hypothetical protein